MIRATVLALMAMQAACQADETVARYGASGTTWHLVRLNGTAFDAPATLVFAPGGPVSGQGPCNSFSGTNTVPYPWFEVAAIASTKRACPDVQAEAAYFQALTAMTQSEVQPTHLFLRNDAGDEMVFKAAD